VRRLNRREFSESTNLERSDLCRTHASRSSNRFVSRWPGLTGSELFRACNTKGMNISGSGTCMGFRGAVHDFLVSLSLAPMQSSSGYRLRPTLRHQEQDPRFEVVVDSARLRGTLIHVRSVRPAMHTLVWAL